RKLDRSRSDGVFVLTVDPWGLDMKPGDGDGTGWAENEQALARLRTMSMRPNIEYLLTEYDKPILTPLLPGPDKESDMLLHENGWLEVRINMDSAKVARRTAQKLKDYRRNAKVSRLSPLRVACLMQLADSLSPYGTVVLARLPVSAEMLAIEDEIVPHFDAVMHRIAHAKGILYLNYARDPGHWIFTDGNHLAAVEAGRLAALIGANLRKD
ncbi:MAG TPA: hypothetical protein PKY96_02035, partial [Flavobacteriales bacterium]|nr:hypothetical protein [Flavobacteriales bacterium]